MADKCQKNFWLFCGIVLSSLLMVPYLILGEDSIIPYHDQLDGELMGYLLTAKYLFTGADSYPELMNGLPVTGAVPPAPLFVLLYRSLPPIAAFLTSQWILYVVGFVGMYLVLECLTGKRFLSFAIGMIFTLFSFYPVYGLCIPGQPLLLWAVLQLEKTERNLRPLSGAVPAEHSGKGILVQAHILLTLPYLAVIVLYGLCSSPVLVGFAVCLLLLVHAIVSLVRAQRRHMRPLLTPWLEVLLLGVTYLVANFPLVRQILSGSYVSHKTEVVYSAQGYVSSFLEAFTQGISYTQSWQIVIFPLVFVCALLIMARAVSSRWAKRSSTVPPLPCAVRAAIGKRFLGVLCCILVLCVLYSFYLGGYITDLRNASDGVLKSFNLMRIVWLLPTGWCLLAGFAASYLVTLPDPAAHAPGRKPGLPAQIFVLLTLIVWGGTALYQSPLKANIMKLIRGGDYYAMTWSQFFAEDLFEEINETIGRPQDSYRVVSLGIYPAAAAYNGFYCLDAYSNNYPVSYKHEFREICAAELEKNDYIRAYYDDWGNRCYLMSAQYANYFTFEKKWGASFDDLELDTDKLREMGCEYLFSAGYITNAEDMGLTLLREEPFETEGSWYRIYVYVVP